MPILTGDILYGVVAAIVGIITVLYLYFKWTFTFWKNKGVPYFEPTVIWGNLCPPNKRTVSVGEEIAELYRKAKERGWKHLGFYNTATPAYLPIDLDLIKHILAKDFSHFVDRGAYVNERDEPVGAHLFALSGKKWRNLRMKFTPTFTSGKMKVMFQTMADCGIQLEKYLFDEVGPKGPINVKIVLSNFATDIVGSCAFGMDCNSFKNPENTFREMADRIFVRSGFGNLKFFFALNFPKTARFLRVTILGKEINDFFTKVVTDNVNYREKNQVHRKDFLQSLIEIKNDTTEGHVGDGTSLTLNEIIAQSFVFFIAGLETSSTTMTFALYELSKNQEIQQRVRDEINAVLKKHDGKVTYDALNEMKYLGQVIDETLRIYPAVPFITRECVEDYEVPGMNLKFEKGQQVFIPIRGIHYDEEYYPSPEMFDPERFSDDNKHDRNQYAHIPFGEGPRICIGMRFGIMQTKVGMISILKNFKVTVNKKTIQPIELDINSIVPQVKGGVWLDLQKIV